MRARPRDGEGLALAECWGQRKGALTPALLEFYLPDLSVEIAVPAGGAA